jgi:hypothetical protein
VCINEENTDVIRYNHGSASVIVNYLHGHEPNSNTNFAYSSWGFTQTCKQVMEELRPRLMQKRRVRTPLQTLDKYVETFHPQNADGHRVGWIELSYCGEPLRGEGVDVLSTLKHCHDDAGFDVHFWCDEDAEDGLGGEEDDMQLRILSHLKGRYDRWGSHAAYSAGVETIRLTSLRMGEDKESDDKDSNGLYPSSGFCDQYLLDRVLGVPSSDEGWDKVLINLGLGVPKDGPVDMLSQVEEVANFLALSEITEFVNVKIMAQYRGHSLEWDVQFFGKLELTWTRKSGRKKRYLVTPTVDGLCRWNRLNRRGK